MIVEFSVENYRSFKDLTTCSFVRSQANSKEEYKTTCESKSKVIRKGLQAFNELVVFTEKNDMVKELFEFFHELRLFFHKFLSKEEYLEHIEKHVYNKEKPVFFEIVFVDRNDLEMTMYRFGYEINILTKTIECYFYRKKKSDKREKFIIKRNKFNKKITLDDNTSMDNFNATENIKKYLSKYLFNILNPVTITSIEDMRSYTMNSTSRDTAYLLLDTIIESAKEDRLLIIEDLDFNLNPYEKKELIREVRNNITNKIYPNFQMLFSSRDLVFLSGLMEADQIYFIDWKIDFDIDEPKTFYELYSLCEFENYEKTDWMKGYLHGRYSAVPVNSFYNYLNNKTHLDTNT